MVSPAESLARHQQLVEPLRLGEELTQGDLARTLRDAQRSAQQLVRENLMRSGIGGTVRVRQLQQAMSGMGQLNRSLWSRIGALVRGGIADAADLSAEQAVRRVGRLGMPAARRRAFEDLVFYDAKRAAEDIINHRKFGFKLADRIYRNGQASTLRVGQLIDQALAQQLSAREIAGQVGAFFSPEVPGGTSYAAMRLARTEINNAHHDTTVSLTKDQPWVQGFEWHLSGSHPKPDPCDDLADRSPYKPDDVPSKPHPQCLCYLEIIQPDRSTFLRNLASGKYD